MTIHHLASLSGDACHLDLFPYIILPTVARLNSLLSMHARKCLISAADHMSIKCRNRSKCHWCGGRGRGGSDKQASSTRHRWQGHATSTPRPSDTSTTYWRQSWHLLWRAVWYCRGWTIATLCCTVLQPAVLEAATRAEHCGADRSSGAKEVTCSAAPGTAALAASPPADRLQAGHSDTQDPCNIHTILPERSHQTSWNHTSTLFIHNAATSQTDYENTFRRPRFPMLCSLCLELVGLWNITL